MVQPQAGGNLTRKMSFSKESFKLTDAAANVKNCILPLVLCQWSVASSEKPRLSHKMVVSVQWTLSHDRQDPLLYFFNLIFPMDFLTTGIPDVKYPGHLLFVTVHFCNPDIQSNREDLFC